MDDQGWRTVAWGVAAVVAVLVCVRLVGRDQPPPPVRIDGASQRGGDRAARRAERALYVHVAGAVRRPGLYRVAAGSRVAVAIERAGGPRERADVSAVNLAAILEDGQQVLVPSRQVPGAPGAGASGPISLGAATAEELETLDGIGPTLAQRIVEARRESGGFSSVDDLAEVDGIGEQRLESLKEALAP